MTADTQASPLRVLVWCPFVNAGGGARLLSQLAHALARQPGVGLLRLAIPFTSHPLLWTGSTDSALELIPLVRSPRLRRLLPWVEAEGRIPGIPGLAWLKHRLRNRFLRATPTWLDAQLSRLARDCDLVYVFWPHRQHCPRLQKPLVCTFQDSTFFDFPEILGGRETKAEYDRAKLWIERAGQVVVSSKTTRTALVRQFGDAALSARVIHHAILPDDKPLTTRMPQRFGALPERYVMCLSNVAAHKNLDNLFIAWSKVARTHQLPLVLAGWETDRLAFSFPDWPVAGQLARLNGLIHRLGLKLNQDYFALGYVNDSDVLPLLQHAQALIMPSLAEGGGSFPVEEALACGIPVCCSDIPVMREHLSMRTARISWFDPLSHESIVTAVEQLVRHYPEYKEGAVAGMADSRPTWDDVAREYVTVFRSVVEQASVPVTQ